MKKQTQWLWQVEIKDTVEHKNYILIPNTGKYINKNLESNLGAIVSSG